MPRFPDRFGVDVLDVAQIVLGRLGHEYPLKRLEFDRRKDSTGAADTKRGARSLLAGPLGTLDGVGDQRRVIRGSNASRRPSPIILKLNSVRKIAMPGKKT